MTPPVQQVRSSPQPTELCLLAMCGFHTQALDAQAPRARSASPSSSDSSQDEGSPLPPRRASHPSGGGLTRSSSLPEQHTPWAASPVPAPAAGLMQTIPQSRKSLGNIGTTAGSAASAAVGGAVTGLAGSTSAVPMDPPSQQQLSPREGWQQLMSTRHVQQQQQQQQQQQPRRSPRTDGWSPRESPSPSAAFVGAPRNSATAELAVAERQPSVALKVARLLSGAAASASAAWGHLVGAGSRSGWVDPEQLRQLQEREQEAKQKARHMEVRAPAGP
jgi:hypothetical protein